jgi:hypothetical protein
MLLSTSNSKQPVPVGIRQLDLSTVAILGTVIGMLVLVEIVTAIGFDRTSQVQRRELGQRQALLATTDSSSGRVHIAVLGNSLLLDAIDVPSFAAGLEPRATPVPYFVLATLYYDWFYGIKRLFAEGMRPRYVLVGLSPNQLASSRTRGDYSARYLFQQSDLLEIIRHTHMDATTASGFILSHYSHYYSTRGVTRGFLLSRLLPSVGELLQEVGGGHEPDVDEKLLRQMSVDRLRALDALCAAYGSRLILVVPPTYQRGAQAIADVGTTLHVPVLIPLDSDELDPSYYKSDGFHLNEKGARLFTARLTETLLTELPR